jgi:hypothetical protein
MNFYCVAWSLNLTEDQCHPKGNSSLISYIIKVANVRVKKNIQRTRLLFYNYCPNCLKVLKFTIIYKRHLMSRDD